MSDLTYLEMIAEIKDSLLILENTHHSLKLVLEKIIEKSDAEERELIILFKEELAQIEFEIIRLKKRLFENRVDELAK